MYKDAYRHTFLGNLWASGPQLGAGDHVSVGPDLVERSAALSCVKSGMFCFTIALAMVLRASLVQATDAPIDLEALGAVFLVDAARSEKACRRGTKGM